MTSPKLHSRLRAARVRSGMTLREVAIKSRYKISHGYIHQLEIGAKKYPHPQKLRVLCDIYGLSFVDLMTAAGYFNKKDIRGVNVQ